MLCTNDLAGFQLMYEDGLAESVEGTFSRTLEFTDVSYENEREDQQDAIFDKLCSLHHFFQSPECYQLNLVNVPRTTRRVERYLPETGANKDMAVSYNDLIEQKQREGRGTECERRELPHLLGARRVGRAGRRAPARAARGRHGPARAHGIQGDALGRPRARVADTRPARGARRAVHARLREAREDQEDPRARLRRAHRHGAVYPPEERTLRRTLQMPADPPRRRCTSRTSAATCRIRRCARYAACPCR